MKHVVCLHEVDEGIGWKHTSFRTCRASVTRNRVLVVQMIVTVDKCVSFQAHRAFLNTGERWGEEPLISDPFDELMMNFRNTSSPTNSTKPLGSGSKPEPPVSYPLPPSCPVRHLPMEM